ncbi:MAG TPA: fatty acid desaturase [Burkholderiales bacterium]|nr:fatty acid desaturase [Burkholderiales bacterium]
MLTGLLDLPWWGYIVIALALTHVTIVSVTIFLHRHQAHRGLDLHPAVSHFFRLWLWLTTGMVTKEWVAIHRKHHAKCETVDDPHSPQVFGIQKLLLEGSELYRKEAKNQETMEKFGHGTPNDWLEKNVYSQYSWHGVGLTLAVNLLLFGPVGATIWAVQMLWIPITAAGIINGIGHYWGYRNFASEDASRNIMPWGIIIGGEELHNNHHAYGTSAKLSSKWYEFDIGWFYIRILETLKLAKVLRVAPKVKINQFKTVCDAETLQAIITHRYEVLAKFTNSLKHTAAVEINNIKASNKLTEMKDFKALERVKNWLHRDASELPEGDRATLNIALTSSKVLATIYSMRQELSALWGRSTASKEQLVRQLEDWCRRAEESGIVALQQFSRQLRSYA